MVYRRAEAEMGGYAHEMDQRAQGGVRCSSSRAARRVRPRRERQAVAALQLAADARRQARAGHRGRAAGDLVALAIGQSKLRDQVAPAFPGVELDATRPRRRRPRRRDRDRQPEGVRRRRLRQRRQGSRQRGRRRRKLARAADMLRGS